MKKQEDRGFIEIVVLIIIALAALKYLLDWDIFDAAASEEGQGTISYLRKIFDTVWTYIGSPVTWTWNNVFWPILELGWRSLQEFIEWGKDNAASQV